MNLGHKEILYRMLYLEAMRRIPIARGNGKSFNPLKWHYFAIKMANYILAAIGESYHDELLEELMAKWN